MLDTLIRGAKIVDGTGKAAFTADVGILDGMIEAVGNLSGAQAFETIEAAGRVLTPGFIDMHRHADAALFREGFGEAELCQGLTTLVNGNCGMSLAPLSGAHADECAKYLAPITGNIPPELRFASIDSYFKAAQGRGLPLSCAELIGMGTLRTLAAGFTTGDLSPLELRDLHYHMEAALADGACGVSLGLGYAPEDFGGLLHYLKRRGFSEEELETSGLVKRSAKGNLYDIFRHRVMVPIIDVRGAIIAFGGRVLDDSKPKYINSPETMVYHKSRTLFALNIAKKSKNRRYILCEGYMDVISMHEAGFDTAVCACGTALTPEQAKLLSEYADEVVLSYDSDEAGQKATERSLGILGSTTLKVSVLSYQGAKDPDEFIKKYGRERFEMLLNGTANPTEFQLKKSKAKYDLRSDDGRLSYIREAIEILTERGVSPTARDVYAGRLADETGVSKQAILSQLNGALQAAARRSYRKEQRDLSKEGIASDIRVPYTSSGESALGAANAARQLAVAMLQDPEQVPYVRARLDMSTVLVPEMQRALEAIFRCVDEHLPLNQTSLQQMLDEAAFQQLAHGQAYNHDIRLQRQDIDMYLDRLQTAKPISEQVKDMSDGQLESYFANLGKKKGARPAETDE